MPKAQSNLHLWQCVFCAASAFMLEVVAAGYTLTLARGQLPAAVAFSFLTPFASLCITGLFIEAPGRWHRVALAASSGVGYSVGTVVVLLMF